MPTEAPELKRAWLHILIALGSGDQHGYGIVRDVLAQTDGGLRLWPVTLYSALDEMVAAGLIRECSRREVPPGTSARRRYYSITDRGRRALKAEARRLASLAELAMDRSHRS
ncbi:MAG: helix-turn-helix transcriptional regulator [Vicinamibacterales bacterium]